jgi:hypothetical protein
VNCKWIGLIVISFLFVSCVYHDIPEEVYCETSGLSVKVIDSVKASVCGASDGSITVEAEGGRPPYLFSVNDSEEQESPFFSLLESGLYSVAVRDKNNCIARRDEIVIEVLQFDADFLFTEDTVCLSASGTMTVTVNEVNGPYEFKMDDATVTTNNLFQGLKYGDHLFQIRDNNGCTVVKRVTVPRGFTAVSWINDILPIMTESCAKTGCHDGISRPNDWRIYEQVKQNASTIRKKTQDKSMPFDSPLPQYEIDLIACWIDDGALEN